VASREPDAPVISTFSELASVANELTRQRVYLDDGRSLDALTDGCRIVLAGVVGLLDEPWVPATLSRRRSRRPLVAGSATLSVLLAAGISVGIVFSSTGGTAQPCASLTGSANQSFTSVAFSADGKYLLAGNASGRVYLRDLATGQIVYAPQDPGSKGIRAVAFNPLGRFAAADANGHIYLYGQSLVATFASPGVTSIAFSADGDYLVAGTASGGVYLRDLATGQIVNSLQDPGSKGVRAVAFNPDGQFAAADANGHIYLYGQSLVATFTSPDVTSIAFDSHRQYLAAGSSNGQLLHCPSQ
jgi:WD40 repeat protein